MIKIEREARIFSLFSAYKVVLDEKEMCKIEAGQEIELDVPKGKHKLYIKNRWLRSNVVEFDYIDSTVEFECGAIISTSQILFSGLLGKMGALAGSQVNKNNALWIKKK